MDKRTTKRRLLKMAELLLKNARNKKGLKFDLNDWGSVKKPTALISCGTTACAMGLAALSNEFKRQGLTYDFWQCDHWSKDGSKKIGVIQNLQIKHSGYEGVDAAMRLFGIDYRTAEFFFTPLNTPDNMQKGAKGEQFLAKRIKHYVKTGELLET